jgi:hypothetical protein
LARTSPRQCLREKHFEMDEDLGMDLTSEKAAARVAKRLAKH